MLSKLFKSKKNREHKQFIKSSLFKVISAQELLSRQRRPVIVKKIEEWAGVTKDTFNCYYLPCIQNYAYWVQELLIWPEPHGVVYSVLDQGLLAVFTALRRRKGEMLPPYVAAEEIEKSAPSWTYAVFTAALSQELFQLILSYDVKLYDRKSRFLCDWNSLLSPMPGNHYYQYHVRPISESTNNHPVLNILLITKIIPEHGLLWLRNDRQVFSAWLGCFQPGSGSPIERIVNPSSKNGRIQKSSSTIKPLSEIKTHKEEQTKATNPVPLQAHSTDSVLTPHTNDASNIAANINKDSDIWTWLFNQMEQIVAAKNTADAPIHRVVEGVLLVVPNLFKSYALSQTADENNWKNIFQKFVIKKHHQIDVLRASDISCFRHLEEGYVVKGLLITNPILLQPVWAMPIDRNLTRVIA